MKTNLIGILILGLTISLNIAHAQTVDFKQSEVSDMRVDNESEIFSADDKKASLTEYKNENKRLDSETRDLKIKIVSLKSQNAKLEIKLKQLADKYKSLVKTRNSTESEARKLQNVHDRLQSQFDSLKEKSDQSSARVANAKATIKSDQELIQQLKRDKIALLKKQAKEAKMLVQLKAQQKRLSKVKNHLQAELPAVDDQPLTL